MAAEFPKGWRSRLILGREKMMIQSGSGDFGEPVKIFLGIPARRRSYFPSITGMFWSVAMAMVLPTAVKFLRKNCRVDVIEVINKSDREEFADIIRDFRNFKSHGENSDK